MDVAQAGHSVQASLQQAGSAAVEAIKHAMPNGLKASSNGTATVTDTTSTVKNAAASSAPALSPKMAATRKPLNMNFTHYMGP